MSENIRLSQLISSRICHDLVGAAGAINAGIELLNEDASDIEAPLGLMNTSAQQVSTRLSFFRVAFGFAGGKDSPFDGAEIKKLCDPFFADKKLSLQWDHLSFDGCSPAQQSAGGKLLMLMLILVADCLPRGGQARVHVSPLNEGLGMAVEAFGTGARYPQDIEIAMNTMEISEQISSRNVHAFYARQLAQNCNGSLEIEVEGDIVQIACVIPS